MKTQGYHASHNTISHSLLKDVRSVVNGIYHMNAHHSIGYAFDASADGQSIAQGMFIDSMDEVQGYQYYMDFKTEEIRRN